MSEIDGIARRTTETVGMIADTVTRFAGKLLVPVAVVCIGGFLLGLTALDGTAEAIWFTLALVFGSLAIGGLLRSMWQVHAVKRHVPELVDEVRSLVASDRAAGRTVIEAFDVDDPERPADGRSALVLTRQVHGLRGAAGSGLAGATRLTAAVAALTKFPAVVLVAIAISIVFGFFALIFLVALVV